MSASSSTAKRHGRSGRSLCCATQLPTRFTYACNVGSLSTGAAPSSTAAASLPIFFSSLASAGTSAWFRVLPISPNWLRSMVLHAGNASTSNRKGIFFMIGPSARFKFRHLPRAQCALGSKRGGRRTTHRPAGQAFNRRIIRLCRHQLLFVEAPHTRSRRAHLVLAAATAVEPAPQTTEHGLRGLFLAETHIAQRHIATSAVGQGNLVPTAFALADLDECLVDQAGDNRAARGLVQGSAAVDAATLCKRWRHCQQPQQRREKLLHCPTLFACCITAT